MERPNSPRSRRKNLKKGLTLSVEAVEEVRVEELASELWDALKLACSGACRRVTILSLRCKSHVGSRLSIQHLDLRDSLATPELLCRLERSILVTSTRQLIFMRAARSLGQ
jgi:hypothetical protein